MKQISNLLYKILSDHSDFLLDQWFSTFLTQQPFYTVPHVLETPDSKIILSLLLNYNFVAVMNSDVL